MMEKLYVHCPSIENIKILDKIPKLEVCCEYPITQQMSTHQNEWGRVKIGNVFVHFLVGQFDRKKCPWCESEPEIVVIEPEIYNIINYGKIFMHCVKCGSRGPVFSFVPRSKKEHMDNLEDMVKCKYSVRPEYKILGEE